MPLWRGREITRHNAEFLSRFRSAPTVMATDKRDARSEKRPEAFSRIISLPIVDTPGTVAAVADGKNQVQVIVTAWAAGGANKCGHVPEMLGSIYEIGWKRI